MKKRSYISFRAFHMLRAQQKGWEVPDFHVQICDFLEKRGRRAVLEVFRGGAKSTLLGEYQAWKLREDPIYLFLDRSADDDTAQKLSGDTSTVIKSHPLCRGMIKGKVGVERFSIEGNPDAARNASVTAYGILSNATSSRANEVINDDVEVPKNISTTDTRQTLRNKLQEEIHILIPGGKVLYVGTPHTHDSVYDEKIKDGYEKLIIPLFAASIRYEADGANNVYSFDFPVKNKDDFYVMLGIHKHARVLDTWEYDFTLHLHDKGGIVKLHEMPTEGLIVDIATGNAWPQRFNRDEVKFRREECRTLNAWDSQYMLKARPVHEIRLNPDRCIVYDDTPGIRYANNSVAISIGNVPMAVVKACWDCSLGKKDSDDSAFAVMFQSDNGHLYWHVLDVLEGDVFDQAKKIVQRVIELQIPSVIIKTQGVGGFLPAILRKVQKEQGVHFGIIELPETTNKTTRILNAYEAPLSGGFLHVYRGVAESGLFEQMRDWLPTKQNQPDDLLDAGEGCISTLPVKIGRVVKEAAQADGYHGFRPVGAVFEVQTDY